MTDWKELLEDVASAQAEELAGVGIRDGDGVADTFDGLKACLEDRSRETKILAYDAREQ